VVGVARLDERDRLAEERIEGAGAFLVGAAGEIADLERRPGEPIIVFIAEHPHEHAGRVAVALDRGRELRQDRPSLRRRRVVDVGDEGAVDVDAVTALSGFKTTYIP